MGTVMTSFNKTPISESVPDGARGKDIHELSARAMVEVAARREAFDKMLKEAGCAKYKIELLFHRSRSQRHPTPGLLSFYESGAKNHGGGDIKIYFCPGRYLGKADCEAVIPSSAMGFGYLHCAKCGNSWEGEQVIGEVGFNLTMQNWAKVLLEYFQRLDLNADLVIKMYKGDIRAMAALEQEREHRGDKLRLTRSDSRVRYVYPLLNIMKDVSAGSDLYRRILAFLSA